MSRATTFALLLVSTFAVAVDQAPAGAPINVVLGIHFVPKPAMEPISAAEIACAADPIGIRFDGAKPIPLHLAVLSASAQLVPLQDALPPSASSWPYRARGLELEIRTEILASGQVLILSFTYARVDAVRANHAISRVVTATAESTGGLPYDSETRQIFSAAAWKKMRVDSWDGEIPDMRKHITIDQYREDDGLYRLVTMGMRKFGFADLAAQEVGTGFAKNIGLLFNAAAQLQAEGSNPRAGQLAITFTAVRHAQARAELQANPGPGATGTATLILSPEKPHEGDPENDLLTIDVPGSGTTRTERLDAASAGAFGFTESAIHVSRGDPRLLAAHERARARLPEIRTRFERGLEPKESLSIKATFTAGDGRREAMWLEVTAWTNAGVVGILANDPVIVADLKVGHRVTVDEAHIDDWLWTHSDGTTEGNESGVVLEQIEAGAARK